MEAVWSKMPNEVDEDTHKEFYRFVSGAFDEPMHKLHYRADAPLSIKALLYIPKFHTEKYGMGRMEKGVSLYSRKVLIESKVRGRERERERESEANLRERIRILTPPNAPSPSPPRSRSPTSCLSG